MLDSRECGFRRALACSVALAAACATHGCELDRPRGSFDGGLLDSGQTHQGGDAATAEDASIPQGGGGSGGSGGEGGAGSGGEGGTGDPRDVVVGDYLLRFDNTTRADNDRTGEITTRTETYGVMRLTRSGDDGLLATEWLCESIIQQSAEEGDVSTTIPGADPWRQITEVKRVFELDPARGTWSTEPEIRRQGWKGGGPDEMPRQISGNGDRLLNPNQDGIDGMTTKIRVDPEFLPGFTCTFGLVSYSITSYDGQLDAEGLPVSAQVQSHGSEVQGLSASPAGTCNIRDVTESNPPDPDVDTLRLKRVEGGVLEGDGKVCPSLADFQAALP